jgi:hypothetical protein
MEDDLTDNLTDNLTDRRQPYRWKTTLPMDDYLADGRRPYQWKMTLPTKDDLTNRGRPKCHQDFLGRRFFKAHGLLFLAPPRSNDNR